VPLIFRKAAVGSKSEISGPLQSTKVDDLQVTKTAGTIWITEEGSSLQPDITTGHF